MKTAVIIPTLNAAGLLPPLLEAIGKQSRKPDEVIVVDSNSRDETQAIALAAGARILPLGARKFNHAGTRRWATEQTDADVLIFLTHDAIPADEFAFANILQALDDHPDAGMAYGRQLPHADANPLARHHRMFNYPADTIVKRKSDIPCLGIKTGYASNSFAAYKVEALRAVGNFPHDLIFGEDTWVASRMILADYAVIYAGNARVFHSHNYPLAQEFKRYFDAGVFLSRNPWIAEGFGGASGEGWRFVRSEITHLRRTGHLAAVPMALLVTLAKYTGYRIGHLEKYLPGSLKRHLSMFGTY